MTEGQRDHLEALLLAHDKVEVERVYLNGKPMTHGDGPVLSFTYTNRESGLRWTTLVMPRGGVLSEAVIDRPQMPTAPLR